LNTQPSEATYQLLVSPESPLHPKTINEVNVSRLVHTSVDNIEHTIPSHSLNGGEVTGTSTEAPTADAEEDKDDEGEGEGELPDHDERSIANTRPPKVCDGIVELDDLVRMMCEVLPGGARSVLGSVPASQSKGEVETENERETFGTRGGLDGMEGKGHGRDEPAYTCFTPLFKLTLGKSFHKATTDQILVFGRLDLPDMRCRAASNIPYRLHLHSNPR
jgi:RNA exonuclease NGL2